MFRCSTLTQFHCVSSSLCCSFFPFITQLQFVHLSSSSVLILVAICFAVNSTSSSSLSVAPSSHRVEDIVTSQQAGKRTRSSRKTGDCKISYKYRRSGSSLHCFWFIIQFHVSVKFRNFKLLEVQNMDLLVKF